MTESLFNDFGGHYVARVDGVEISRHAPSNMWSDYVKDMQERHGDLFTYSWVNADGFDDVDLIIDAEVTFLVSGIASYVRDFADTVAREYASGDITMVNAPTIKEI